LYSLQLISVKTHQKKKVHTYRYSLKYKKLNMQFGQLWSVVNFFLLKINRLFLIRDANFGMSHKKKSSKSRFSTSFFSGETKNKINFDINTEKQ
jgi:hypothetical protein